MGRKLVGVGVVVMLSVLLILTFTLPVPSAEAKEKVYKWRFQVAGARDSSDFKAGQVMANLVKRASNGRLQLTLYAGDEIVPYGEWFDAVGKGVVEMACGFPPLSMSKTGGLSGLPEWPFAFDHLPQITAYLYGLGAIDIIAPAYAEKNIHLVRIFSTGYTDFFATKFPVKSLNDFKGKKIRSLGLQGEVLAEAVPELSQTFLPSSELYSALERGVIDGCAFGPTIFATDYSMHEVVKYLIRPHFGSCTMEIMMPLKLWKDLPEDLKAVVELGAYTYETWMNSDYEKHMAERMQMMREKFGIKIQQLPEDDAKKLYAASARVMDKYSVKDARFAKAAAILKKYMHVRGLIK